MAKHLALFILLSCSITTIFCQTQAAFPDKDTKIINEIKRLHELEHNMILKQDANALRQFYPEDLVVINQFNQFIDKQKVLERLKANIIKYTSYERSYEYFHVYGEALVVVGIETVVPTIDSDRPDAGKIVKRRFSETWVKKGNSWKKVLRHVSTIATD